MYTYRRLAVKKVDPSHRGLAGLLESKYQIHSRDLPNDTFQILLVDELVIHIGFYKTCLKYGCDVSPYGWLTSTGASQTGAFTSNHGGW
jgi:hypothetical protein